MKDLVLAFLSIAGLFLAFGLPMMLRRATRRQRHFEKQSEIFFRKTAALADDDDTPEELLIGLQALNDTIHRRDGGKVLLAIFLGPPPESDRATELRAEFDAHVRPFFERRPELRRAFTEAVGAWVHAILCQAKGPFGLLARLLLTNSLSLMDPTRLAGRVAQRKLPRDHMDDKHTPTHPPIDVAVTV